MAQFRLAALQQSRRPEYMLVEWEGGEHSVVDGKYAVGACFEDGEKIMCKLKEGEFQATILTTGSRAHCCEVQSKREKSMDKESQDDETGSGMSTELPIIHLTEEKETVVKKPSKRKQRKKVTEECAHTPIAMHKKAGKKVKGKVTTKKAREVASSEMANSLMEELHLLHSPLNMSTPVKDDEDERQTGTDEDRNGAMNDGERLTSTDGKQNGATDNGAIETGTTREGEKETDTATGESTSDGTGAATGRTTASNQRETQPFRTLAWSHSDLQTPSRKRHKAAWLDTDHWSSSSVSAGQQSSSSMYNSGQSLLPHFHPGVRVSPPLFRPQAAFLYPPGPPSLAQSSQSCPNYHTEEELSDIASSHSHQLDTYSVLNLRDLVLSTNNQTQAALAALNLSIQNIGAEMMALKEQMVRRPVLKKKKSEEKERDMCNEAVATDYAVFGDPCGQINITKVHLRQCTQSQVFDCERRANTPEKLSIALLLLLFTTDELQHGNCSKPVRDDITQLDTERLWAIKCHLDYRYPIKAENEHEQDEMASKRWQTIIQKNLNSKCRALRLREKP